MWKKYDIPFLLQRLVNPYRHEIVVQKWIDKEPSNVSVLLYHPSVKFTHGAVDFIKTKSPKESSLQIILSYRIIGRVGKLPYVETRLGAVDPNEDYVKLESNTEIPVVVTRKIWNLLKREKVSLTVTTSGFWRFKKLQLRPDLSWFLYKEEKRGTETRRLPR